MTCAVKSAPGVEMAILERHDWREKIHTNTTYTSTLWHYQVLQAHWCIHGVDACQRVNTCVCLKRWLAPEAQSSAAPHALQENYSGTFLAKQNCHEKKNVRKNSATLWKLHPHVEQKPTFRPSVAHVCLAALAPKMAKRRPLCSSLKELRTRLLGM